MSDSIFDRAGKTVIAGLGATGFSCLEYLLAQGSNDIVVIDSRKEPPFAARARTQYPDADYRLGDEYRGPGFWSDVSLLVVSPGVAPDDPLLAGSKGIDRCSDIDLFMSAIKVPVVGITGTNGKSTATSLLGHMLEQLGLKVRMGGNLGEPALSILTTDVDLYVLELSSFQLEYSGSLPLTVGALLNVSDDHLDRHGSLENYAAIKRQVFATSAAAVYNVDDPNTKPVNSVRPGVEQTSQTESFLFGFGAGEAAQFRLNEVGELFYMDQRIACADEFALRGRHNHFNLLAAMAIIDALSRVTDLPGLATIDTAKASYVASAQDFPGLPHRCELVAEIDGVSYINDSKATNVGACIASLESLSLTTGSADVLLLAGGQAKGATFTELADVVSRRVKKALLFGEDARLLEAALDGSTSIERCADLPAAVQGAYSSAIAGDIVLLAPACASMDMFENYMARGEAFRAAVASL